MNVESGAALRRLLVAGATSADILKLLKTVENPDKGLQSIIKRLAKLVEKHDKGSDGYGHEVDIEGLTGIYKELKAIKDPPEQVVSAIKQLKILLGIKDESKDEGAPAPVPSVPSLGNIPSFDMSKMQAAVPYRPGVYKARFIRAGKALDGKIWDKDVLKAAVEKGLFEGIPLNVITYTGQYGPVDYHLSGDTDFVGQIVGNQVGFCQNATWDDNEGAVYGEVWVTDPARRALIDTMVEQNHEPPGISIYATGDLDDTNRVRDIELVHSLDLVTFPAADGAILAPALAASVSRWGEKELRKLGAADVPDAPAQPPTNEQPAQGAQQPNQQPTQPEQPNNEPFGFEWLKQRASEIVDDILQHQPWPDGLKGKFDTFVEALKSYDYDKTSYPVEVMTELPRMVYEMVQEAKQEKKPEQPQGNENAGNSPQQQPQAQPNNNPPVGGGLKGMDRLLMGSFENVVKSLNDRLASLEERVGAVDTEAMVADKLAASGLPLEAQAVIRDTLAGAVVSPDAVDRFIEHDRKMLGLIDAGLRHKAAVTISGESLDGGSVTDVESELATLLGVKTEE